MSKHKKRKHMVFNRNTNLFLFICYCNYNRNLRVCIFPQVGKNIIKCPTDVLNMQAAKTFRI